MAQTSWETVHGVVARLVLMLVTGPRGGGKPAQTRTKMKDSGSLHVACRRWCVLLVFLP